MHIVTVKVVRIINKAVISSFCPATYEKQLYARITHNFTHVEDRRQLEKEKKNLSASTERGKLHVGVSNSPEYIPLMCALINTHIYTSKAV